MYKNLKAIAHILAGFNMSSKDIDSFYNDIVSLGPDGLRQLVKKTSNAVDDINQTFYLTVESDAIKRTREGYISFDIKNNPIKSNKNKLLRSEDDIYDRVEKLLLIDSKLSSQKSAEILMKELEGISNISLTNIPVSYLRSLRELIKKLSDILPEKSILEAATLIRNRETHNPKRDWNISENTGLLNEP